MSDKRCALPVSKISGLSFTDNLDDMRELQTRIEGYGIRTDNTRIDRYIKYLELIVKYDPGIKTNVFNDPEENPFKSQNDRLLYVLREVHELGWIHRGLNTHLPKGLKEKLEKIVGGTDFAALDSNTVSRNTQFELRVASYFCQDGYDVDLSQETDIIATKARETHYVECKRVGSIKKLGPRLIEARKQLQTRIPKSTYKHNYYGIAAIDVTKVAFKHNGLTFGITVDNNKDLIQEKLVTIGDQIVQRERISPTAKRIILTWLQIHISAMTIYPAQHLTRFSSFFIENPKINGKYRRAFKRLRSTLEIGRIKDPREVAGEKLKLRKIVTFPKNTILDWDDELLKNFIKDWELPKRDKEYIVLKLSYPGSNNEFMYAELEFVVANLSASQKDKYCSNLELAGFELAAQLFQFRYPYEE